MFSNIDYFNIDVFFEHCPSLPSFGAPELPERTLTELLPPSVGLSAHSPEYALQLHKWIHPICRWFYWRVHEDTICAIAIILSLSFIRCKTKI